MRALERWFTLRRPVATRPHKAVADWATPVPEPTADELAPPKGCAWYDSSLDLQRGLLVRELARPAVSFVL